MCFLRAPLYLAGGMGEDRVGQRHHLKTLAETHAVGEDTAGSRVLLNALQRLKTGVPHELDAFDLVRLELLGQVRVHRHQLLFGGGVKVQYQVVDARVHQRLVADEHIVVVPLSVSDAPPSLVLLFRGRFRLVLRPSAGSSPGKEKRKGPV